MFGPALSRAAACVWFAVGSLLLACPADYPPSAHPELAVPASVPAFLGAEEAATWVGHDGVRFIDARPTRLYRAGHIPGAISLDWLSFREADGPLPTGIVEDDTERIATALGRHGLTVDDWAIVVGDPQVGWGEEGRIAWMLLSAGQGRVSVLDGGQPAWVRAGLPVQRGTVRLPVTEYLPSPRRRWTATKDEVREMVRDRSSWRQVVVDVREPEEYRGTEESPSFGTARRGHIAGAVNLPWRSLLDEEGQVLPRDKLGEILIPLGIRPDTHVVLYCTGGVRSAHTWYVLHTLGFPDVRSYAGSFWEWSLDRRMPVELGGTRPRPVPPPWPPPEETAPPSFAPADPP